MISLTFQSQSPDPHFSAVSQPNGFEANTDSPAFNQPQFNIDLGECGIPTKCYISLAQ